MALLKKHNHVLFFLGCICLAYWIADFINNVVITHRPSWILWYSSAGLLTTALTLLSENEVLIYSMFTALFIMESLWSIDFIYVLIFKKNLLNIASYAFAPGFSKKDFIMTLYHPLIPIGLILSLIKTTKIYRFGWFGASIFGGTLLILSFLFVSPNDSVNCIYPVAQCTLFLHSFQHVPPLNRVVFMFAAVIAFFYIPTSYLIVWLKKIKHKT